MSANFDAKMNVNKFVDLVKEGITALIPVASVHDAAIFNDSGSDVTFYVYNYADTVHWISAMKSRVANQHFGIVAASGAFFKIHPNGDSNQEFLVAPHAAYIYRGPGKLEKVKTTD